MTDRIRRISAITMACAALAGAPNVRAATPDISGAWQLNRGLSQMPRQMGFGVDLGDTPVDGRGPTAARGGRGTRSGGGTIRVNGPSPRFESEEDAQKIRELTSEAQQPPEHFTIAQSERAVTIADEGRRPQILHPNGKEETYTLEAGPIGVVSKWEARELVVRYLVEKDRELRYRYSRDTSGRLVVQTQFADHGKGDVVTRVYDPQ